MSLLLAGLVFAGTSGALWVGRWIVRRRTGDGNEPEKAAEPADGSRADDSDAAADPPPKSRAAGDDAPPKREAPPRRPASQAKRTALNSNVTPRLDGFVCQLGDVLLRHTGEEAWLAGGVVLSEEVPVAVLFVAPDAGHDCAIYVHARPSSSVLWLEPLDPSAVLVGGEPPSSVEYGGIRFDRARRLPLRPRRIGVGAPDLGDAVVVAEYVSAGAERLVVMKANVGTVAAYRGLELAEGSFEVIASGDATLES